MEKRGNRPTGSSACSGWRWTFLPSSRCNSPWSTLTGPCFTSPSVWLSVPEGPVLIYAHHFLPQGILLLDISAFLPNFYHLFSESRHREWHFFPNKLLLNATPAQGLAPHRTVATQQVGHTPRAHLTPPSPSLVCVNLFLCLYSQQQQKVKKVKPSFLFCLVKALIRQNS